MTYTDIRTKANSFILIMQLTTSYTAWAFTHRALRRLIVSSPSRKFKCWHGVGSTEPISAFPLISSSLSLSKHWLRIENHVYIWQVLPWPRCGDNRQIRKWFKEPSRYFCKINFPWRRNWRTELQSAPPSVVSLANVTVSSVARLQNVNTLRPRQNGRHFPHDIFNWIFLDENVWIPIKISLKFVPKGPISNIPALVQIMAWRRSGDKPLSEPMMVSALTHICVTRPQWVKQIHLRWVDSSAISRGFLRDFTRSHDITSYRLTV